MVDKDLLSIQESRSLVRGARTAQMYLAGLTQEKVNNLTLAISQAGIANAKKLAQLAVENTGFGIPEDKTAKNMLASNALYRHIAPMKTIGIISDDTERKLLQIATPAGVIAGLIPSTNPTSTTIYKAMISIKAGSAIVFSPHPSAARCIRKTVEMIREALSSQGAPADLVTMMSIATLEGTQELMKQADLILATGGPAMVRAAYRSGTPALGVGAGNVPVFIEKTANIPLAIDRILVSKTFDNGTVCSSEQAIVTENAIADEVCRVLETKGGYFLDEVEVTKVKSIMERPDGNMNPAIVGKPARFIADLAGISIPEGTKVLVYKEKGIGKEYPFSKEKLTALIGFYVTENWQQACEVCFKLLKNGGIGHSLAIHSENDSVIREFAMKKPVSRLLVNTPATHGAVGISTDLPPSFTLGCGTVGGSSTSDNVGPLHLFNTRWVAYGTKDIQAGSGLNPPVTPESAEVDMTVKAITEMVLKKLQTMS